MKIESDRNDLVVTLEGGGIATPQQQRLTMNDQEQPESTAAREGLLGERMSRIRKGRAEPGPLDQFTYLALNRTGPARLRI